jgi:hypothetical protein
MPVRHARSEMRGRPPFGRRDGIGKNGSTRFHNTSGSSVAAISRSRYLATRICFRVLLQALSAGYGVALSAHDVDRELSGGLQLTGFSDNDNANPHALEHRSAAIGDWFIDDQT